MQWYSDQGYQWALVEIQHAQDSSSIIININEGLIKTIKTEYYTASYERMPGIFCTKSIEQYLGVELGLPLNVLLLQRKINYLKENKLVANVIYSIERSTDDFMGLDIVFQIQELKDKELLVFSESSSKAYRIMSYAMKVFSQYNSFSDWLISSNIIVPSSLEAYYFYFQPDYTYNHDHDLNKGLVYSFFRHTFPISNYRKFNSLQSWTQEKTVGFKLYLRSLSNFNSFWVFSIKLIRNTFDVKASYLNPSLSSNKNFSFELILQVFRKKYLALNLMLPNLLEKQDIAVYIFESSLLYNFTSSFSISEKIVVSRTSLASSFFQNFKILSFSSNVKDKITNNYSVIKQRTNLFYQEFIALLLNLHYQNFDFSDWPLYGYLLDIKSLYLTPFQKSHFLSYRFVNNYKNLFSHKVSLKQISHFNLPFYFKNRMNHILVSIIRIQSNVSTANLSLLYYSYNNQHVAYEPSFNFCLKAKTEYNIPINKSSRISLFFNYLDYFLMRSSKQKTTLLKQEPTCKTVKNPLTRRLFCGLGLQVKLPIKEMPPLSIEYTINSNCQFCIYLHISHQR